jgi:hypothetical protein
MLLWGGIFCDGINTWLRISLKRDFFQKQKKTKKNKESASFVYQQLNYPFLGHRLEFIGRTS